MKLSLQVSNTPIIIYYKYWLLPKKKKKKKKKVAVNCKFAYAAHDGLCTKIHCHNPVNP